jgi:hypothetical protein
MTNNLIRFDFSITSIRVSICQRLIDDAKAVILGIGAGIAVVGQPATMRK